MHCAKPGLGGNAAPRCRSLRLVEVKSDMYGLKPSVCGCRTLHEGFGVGGRPKLPRFVANLVDDLQSGRRLSTCGLHIYCYKLTHCDARQSQDSRTAGITFDKDEHAQSLRGVAHLELSTNNSDEPAGPDLHGLDGS